MAWLDIRPEELTMEARSLDTMFWSSIVDKRPAVRKAMPKRAQKVVGGDLFQSLYQWDPKLKDEPVDSALAAWISNRMSEPSFQQLRNKTMGNRNLAAGASVRLYRELMRARESQFKAIVNTKDSLDSMEQLLGDTPAAQGAIDAIKKAQQELAEGIKQDQLPSTNEYGQFAASEEGQAASKAVENVLGDLEVSAGMSDFDQSSRGADLDPNNQNANVLDNMVDESVISRIKDSEELRNIFRVAGRMRMILQEAKSKKPQIAPPPVNVTYGNDLSDLLSSELANLSDEDSEDLFWLRFLEGSLLQYDHKDKVNEGLGPFICCVDFSGSMSGQPLLYAKALFVSLARMAVAKHRKIIFMPFASQAHQGIEILSGQGLTSALQNRYTNIGGGTRFEPPLNRSMEIIQESAVWKNADILFITDGDSSIPQSWIDKFQETKNAAKFRLVGINVSGRWRPEQIPMYDATSSMGGGGDLSKLEWLSNVADRMVR